MSVFKAVARLLMLVTVHVTLFGCGSGGGEGTSAAGKTRMLQAGDSWTYDYSGQSQSEPYAGTVTVSITPETLNGEPVIAATSLVNLNGSSSTYTAIQYMQQDPATGDIALYGKKTGDNPLITVTDRPLPVIWPGTWETGKTITPDVHYSDGSTDSTSYTVIGQETVTTPAGAFTAWKCAISGSSSGTVWFSPQLGYFARNDLINGTNTVSSTLRSTNIAGS